MFAFKISVIASVLLTAYGVDLSVSDDDFCAEHDRDRCHSEQTRRPQFPANVEDLDKMCPAVLVRLDCVVEYQNRCSDERVRPGSMEERLPIIRDIASEACDKTSELHEEFAANLPCIKRLMSNHRNVCQPIVEDAVDAVKTRIFGEDADEEILDYRKLLCLYEAFDYACIVARSAVTCGSETKEFVGKIMDRVGFLDVVCQGDITEEVKEMVDIMQVEMQERLALGQLLSKK